MTERPGRCSSSAEGVRLRFHARSRPSITEAATECGEMAVPTYLPLFELVLLGLVLLDQVVENFLEALGVGLEGGDDILDCALHQHAVDHAEALAIPGKGLQGL